MRSQAGLLSTVAWLDSCGTLTYALEGSVFVTGAAIQWLRDGLGLLDNAAQSEALARSVADSGGVVFVPALTGLGAPDWDPDARGAIFGLTRGTTRAHLVRATLEAIAFEVRDVVDVMAAEAAAGCGQPAPQRAPGGRWRPSAQRGPLRVDGGAAANDLLCSCRPTSCSCRSSARWSPRPRRSARRSWPGWRPACGSHDELAATWRLDRRFEPGPRDDAAHARWRDAVRRSMGWASQPGGRHLGLAHASALSPVRPPALSGRSIP